MKKILFCALMLISASASAREYNIVCKWADGTKDVYTQKEIWTASITQTGTSMTMNDGSRIEYSNAVQCKMVVTKE